MPAAPNKTPRAFKAKIGAWRKATAQKIDALARQTCFEMGERVVIATPVDTGFLRGSWQPSIGALPKASAAGALDPGGAKALAAIGLTITDVQPGDRFYMANNAVYALRIEYGFVGQDSLGRKYNQAGRYFVTDTVKKWQAVVDDVAKSLKMEA